MFPTPDNTEARNALPDHLRNVGVRQVSIMALDHPGVPAPQVLRHYHQWGASHDGQTGPGVAQLMEGKARIDHRPFHRLLEAAEMQIPGLGAAVSPHQQRGILGPA